MFSRTEDGPLPGCITERLGDGAELTIPVMASFCSRHCYLHHKRDQLARVEKCPQEGVVHNEIDPDTLPNVDNWRKAIVIFWGDSRCNQHWKKYNLPHVFIVWIHCFLHYYTCSVYIGFLKCVRFFEQCKGFVKEMSKWSEKDIGFRSISQDNSTADEMNK